MMLQRQNNRHSTKASQARNDAPKDPSFEYFGRHLWTCRTAHDAKAPICGNDEKPG
jgi:hypothetical protein